MVSPIDYSFGGGGVNPLEMALGGFNAARDVRREDVLDERATADFARKEVLQGREDTLFGQSQEDRALALQRGEILFGQQQADRQRGLAEVERQRAEAISMRDDLAALADMENPDAEDYADFLLTHPSMKDTITESWDMLDERNKDNALLNVGRVYSALRMGNTEMANGIVTDRAAALRNSGREDEAAEMEVLTEAMQISPAAARDMAGIMFQAMGGKVPDAPKTSVEMAQELANLRKTQADIKKTDADVKAAKLKFDQSEKSGGASQKEVFEFEDKLRKQYVARTGDLPKSRTQYQKLLDSANVPNAETGAGDVALVFSFMKMLDPGSVVRESEFALAKDTAGLLQRLKNTMVKAEKGEFMSPTQRREMVALAGKYMEAALAEEARVRGDLMGPVNSYGLSAENVFGTIANETPTLDEDFKAVFGGGN